MGKMTDFERFMIQEQKVIYNGVEMTKKQADALKRKEARKNAIKKRNDKIIPLLPKYINMFTKNLKLCKSLEAYYHNGYRQWGTIVKEVTEHPCIAGPFIMFVQSVNEINKNKAIIEKIAKKNDKDAFGYIEKLHYAIDDAKTRLDALSDGIAASQILQDPTFKGKEFIYGTGRRLGIKELCSRTMQTMILMQNAIDELKKLCEDGIDAMEYDANSKKTITFVTCG